MYPLKADTWNPSQFYMEKFLFKKEILDNLEIKKCVSCESKHFDCPVCKEWNCLKSYYKDLDFIVCTFCKTPFRTNTVKITEVYPEDCNWSNCDSRYCDECGEEGCNEECILDED
jgi:hypothetical protein